MNIITVPGPFSKIVSDLWFLVQMFYPDFRVVWVTWLHSLKLTASKAPENRPETHKGNESYSKHPLFRCEVMLVSGSVIPKSSRWAPTSYKWGYGEWPDFRWCGSLGPGNSAWKVLDLAILRWSDPFGMVSEMKTWPELNHGNPSYPPLRNSRPY